MKTILAIMLCAASPCLAQSSYDTGYSRGYNDQFSAPGLPNTDTEFARGFQTGQDDSYEDDQIEQRRMRDDEKRNELEMQRIQHPEGNDDGK